MPPNKPRRRIPPSLTDVYTRLERPFDPNWDVVDPNKPSLPQKDIIPPRIPIIDVEGMEKYSELIDHHLIPRMMQVMGWGVSLYCQKYKVTKPASWLAEGAPRDALPLDERHEGAITFNNNDERTLIDFTVPDRFAGVINRIGLAVSNIVAWGNIVFRLYLNDRPVFGYADFRTEIGPFNNPTATASHILLKHGDRVRVTGQLETSTIPFTVFFRLMGHLYRTRDVTDDGTYRKEHTSI